MRYLRLAMYTSVLSKSMSSVTFQLPMLMTALHISVPSLGYILSLLQLIEMRQPC